jgi:type I restriction enzyme S subunit
MSSYYEKFLATGEVKCIDEEIPFEIPKGWEWCRVSSVFLINPKVSAKDDDIAAFIPMEAISAGYGSEFRFYEKQWKEIKSGYTAFEDNDIAFAKITPCFQNRKSVIFNGLPNGIGAGTTELKILRTYGETINRYYALYFLESPYFIDEATFKGTANQQRIVVGYLENKLFPLPPLSEQNRVVDKIGILMPIIDKYSKSQETLDKINVELGANLKKSILQEAIQGKLVPQIAEDDTADELLEAIKEEKQRLVKEGKLKKSAINDSVIFKGDDNKYYEQVGKQCKDITEEIPFDLPDSWIWTRGKTVFVPMESTKPISDFTYIDVDAVNNKLNIIDNPKKISIDKAPSRATRKLHQNDILFSMVRPYLRNIALVDDAYNNAIASTGFYVITPGIGYFHKFLFYMMLSNYVVDGLNTFMKGDNSPSINNGHIENYLYPLPPLQEQQRIVAQIERLFEQLK